MCNEVVHREPYTLWDVPDHFKTQEMCNEGTRNNPATFFMVLDCFKTQEMCTKAVEVDPWQLKDIPDHFKSQEMCDKGVWEGVSSLVCVPDWFVTQQQLKIWHDYDEYCNDDEAIEWYDGYKKWKTQKAKIEDERLPIAWHPDPMMNWCVSEDEKRWWK